MKQTVIADQKIASLSSFMRASRLYITAISIVFALFLSMLLWPGRLGLLFSSLLTGSCLGLAACRFWAIGIFLKSERAEASIPPDLLPYAQCPVLTILLPLYDEAHMVEPLMKHIRRIDWPADRLEIILACEGDDLPTISAVKRHLAPPFSLSITSGRGPRTKPNALNQALASSRGDIITIFDAEDIPHPQQARAAAAVFVANLACGAVQAPLTYHNVHDSWLSRQFTLEYDTLFQVWNPALARLGLPFPLGGTSNYVRRCALLQCGGWDSYNVTEDADLTFRLAANGWMIQTINLPTWEEAVSQWASWKKQRSRWIKGYMLSWLVHMSSPWRPSGFRAAKRQLALQMTLGLSIACSLFHLPSLIALGYLYLIGNLQLADQSVMFRLALLCLGLSYLAGMGMSVLSAHVMKRRGLIRHAVFLPFYWMLLFIPALLAVKEIWFHPFKWNKTEHIGIYPPDRASDEPSGKSTRA